jgi:hypothetical protein
MIWQVTLDIILALNNLFAVYNNAYHSFSALDITLTYADSEQRYQTEKFYVIKKETPANYADAQSFCSEKRAELYTVQNDQKILDLFQKLQIDAVWTQIYRSLDRNALVDDSYFKPIIRTLDANIGISEVRLENMDKSHILTLSRIGNRFEYVVTSKSELRNVLCLQSIEFPKKVEDKKGLDRIKVTFIDRIQERIYRLKGWKSYTHNRLPLIIPMKTHLTDVPTENKLDLMQKINTATDQIKNIPTEMETIFKNIKIELDVQVLQNIFEDFITKTDGILDEIMKILIEPLRVPQIPIDSVINKEAGTQLYTVDGDSTTFYIFVGETNFFHLIGQLDTGVRTIFSNFLDNFFHIGLVDLILGSVTILCLINALVQMIYLCRLNKKVKRIEKMPVSKKLQNVKGKSKKESAASHHFRTQKQKEQLEHMDKKVRRARKQMADNSIPLRGGYAYEHIPLHLVPSISELV